MSKTTQNPEVIEVGPAFVRPHECCSDWKPQSDLINGPIILQSVRSGGRFRYQGKPFAYCPWCGTKRP